MANKDLYNVFGSARNSGAGQTQMMKKRTPRPTENTHEHTSGSFGGQNMVNQLTKRATPIGTRQATPIGTRQATPIGTRQATPIGTRRATPINQTANTMTQQLTEAAQSMPMTGGGVGAAGPKQMNPKKRSGGATR